MNGEPIDRNRYCPACGPTKFSGSCVKHGELAGLWVAFDIGSAARFPLFVGLLLVLVAAIIAFLLDPTR